ncbi:50S ribosome-binding GTPase, partial [Candidatus Woesearchaeota archaeon]|nr:50S ribosome-binding GTPase [Candidatus Woesearchaeota archaeon]
MNFQTLQKIESPEFYLDIAIKRGKKEAQKAKLKVRGGDRLRKVAIVESERIKAVGRELHGMLSGIIKNFPEVDKLQEFYRELVKCTTDYNKLKKSFGAVIWADRQAAKFMRLYYSRIRSSNDVKAAYSHKKSYYGRISSALKQIRKEFACLEAARKTMKRFPSVKTDIATLVIAGFPNVGKTTLLRAMTGSEPKIASYPFTTQRLMIGYFVREGRKLQVIDTPGLLDRPLDKRNRIELQAVLALKHLAGKIIFVMDPTGSSGYDSEEQLKLLEDINERFGLGIVVAMNKADIAEKEAV